MFAFTAAVLWSLCVVPRDFVCSHCMVFCCALQWFLTCVMCVFVRVLACAPHSAWLRCWRGRATPPRAPSTSRTRSAVRGPWRSAARLACPHGAHFEHVVVLFAVAEALQNLINRLVMPETPKVRLQFPTRWLFNVHAYSTPSNPSNRRCLFWRFADGGQRSGAGAGARHARSADGLALTAACAHPSPVRTLRLLVFEYCHRRSP